ncbi:Zn-ribbon domain-containing OB-fold protein [Rhodococcoides kyotonense]|uniref:Uncharacterized OB-fold protein, contains Zn-ribbon domain n=1 Tax=Rhodococcoides kyotonense TaxID=398843 RepID=A0A239I2F7_9NOCA|nr:OB-fold domain-containing protein [Rhodococcus kyotonensis]SNS87223.1 Uncharacterized OB-fold protein, contains Zn-ribbon domain [Rhodococcus kyotonensis]
MDRPVIDASLFASLEPPLLVGSRCVGCDVVVFPATTRCPACAADTVERLALPGRGTVWTWTTQSFTPKPPYETPESGFEAFAVGYVDLGSVLVESRLEGAVAIGDDVELVLTEIGCTELGFAFRKVES